MQPPVGAICDKVSVRARRSRNPSPVARIALRPSAATTSAFRTGHPHLCGGASQRCRKAPASTAGRLPDQLNPNKDNPTLKPGGLGNGDSPEALRPLGLDLLAAISDQIPVVLGRPGHRSRNAKCTSVPASALLDGTPR